MAHAVATSGFSTVFEWVTALEEEEELPLIPNRLLTRLLPKLLLRFARLLLWRLWLSLVLLLLLQEEKEEDAVLSLLFVLLFILQQLLLLSLSLLLLLLLGIVALPLWGGLQW